jgi:REP element-mobilizing transposase RayT
MTQPRSTLVSLDDTPWYHVVSRCVRRAFLCGHDAQSGRSFEHRRGWIAERLQQLASVFAIDIAAYAVMSNHFHIVVRIDAERLQAQGRDEILDRWTRLFTGPLLVQRYQSRPESLGPAELQLIDAWVETYRARLADLSWFMRVLNESIARQANIEDGVTGRFWEGRFKSQALLDEQAVLTAMAYVDLNPIRARMAETPETSDYTSVAERIRMLQPTPLDEVRPAATEETVADHDKQDDGATATARGKAPSDAKADSRRAYPCSTRWLDEQPPCPIQGESVLKALTPAPLMPFDATGQMAAAIAFAFDDYLELVEATGRVMREDKRGYIQGETPALLERLGINPERFIVTATRMLQQFGSAIGTPDHITALCAARQARYLRGMGAARRLFNQRAA